MDNEPAPPTDDARMREFTKAMSYYTETAHAYRYMTADLLDAAALADTVKPYRFKTWRRLNDDNGTPVMPS